VRCGLSSEARLLDFVPNPEIAMPGCFDPLKHKAAYKWNYPVLFADIASGAVNARAAWRTLYLNDLFSIACFAMGNPLMNTPFGVRACQMVEANDPYTGYDFEVWARGHLKSWTMTQAQRVQRILKEPHKCALILSYKKPASDKFLFSVMKTLESPSMVACFPDILYENPSTQSPSWSIQNGIIVKGHPPSRKEKTLEGAGLLEGMPTGGHWDDIDYDDVETMDTAKSPDVTKDLIAAFEMSKNLGMPDGSTRSRIIGTFYSHFGLLCYCRDKKDINGNPAHKLRIIPATNDGTKTGWPIFLSQKSLDEAKSDPHTFNTQQLCNPTPEIDARLDFNMLKPIDPHFLPKNRLKFIIIDPAGDKEVLKGTKTDDWGMACIGVKPCTDDLGISDIYIEDGIAATLPLNTAVDAACQLYINNGRIAGVGIERVGNDTTYSHIISALNKRGKYLSIKKTEQSSGNVVLLAPDGMKNIRRIESGLSWPLANGHVYYSTALSPEIIAKLKEEMNKFPFFHVNLLDAISYIYKLLTFMRYSFAMEEDDDAQDDQPQEEAIGRSSVTGY
jgi:hypothetical protein